jgi:hypothetical protein
MNTKEVGAMQAKVGPVAAKIGAAVAVCRNHNLSPLYVCICTQKSTYKH